jgi:hypothetical protein
MDASRAARSAAAGTEAEVAARWARGLEGPLRLADGRRLQVIFPGVPGGGSGPDFRGAILDAGGDLLRGDVEVHLLASGWRAHGHQNDPAYGEVVLHLVGADDLGQSLTPHASGRLIPVLVAPRENADAPPFPPPFTPPCALATAQGRLPGPALERLGLRRLRMKAARCAPVVAAHGPGQALYGLLLETLGGPANRDTFASLSRLAPLAVLLESLDANSASRAFAASAHLKGFAAGVALRRAGLRPMAAPGRRLEAAGELIARLWPAGSAPDWPAAFALEALPASLQTAGVGRSLAIECAVNAVFPVALAAAIAPEQDIEQHYLALPSPGTYGRLKPLERWLGQENLKPFPGAARLQGGLLLHADYCTRGQCGRCPLSE